MPRQRRLLIAAACAVGALLNIWIATHLIHPNGDWQGRNDFLGFYAGARLVGGPNLYDRESVRQEHIRAVNMEGEIQFGRFPCFAFFIKPLAWLPYYRAAAVWEILNGAAFLGFILLWPGGQPARRWPICCWSLPAFAAGFGGQDDLILLLWVALSARLLRAQKPIMAGMILALCSSKFHLFLLVPVVLLAQSRWRMLGGLVAGMTLLLAISFAVAGPHWPWEFYRTLADARISFSLPNMPNLHSIIRSVPWQIAAAIAFAAGVFLAARAVRSYEMALGVALMAGVLVGFHGYLADGCLFLPGLISLTAAAAAWVRWPALLLVTPIPWAFTQLPEPLPVVGVLLLILATCTGMIAPAVLPPARVST